MLWNAIHVLPSRSHQGESSLWSLKRSCEPADSCSGFYSHVFVVGKPSGKFCLIFNLKLQQCWWGIKRFTFSPELCPFGLSSAPRIFSTFQTKIKSYLIWTILQEWLQNCVWHANTQSKFLPSHTLSFLEFVLNTKHRCVLHVWDHSHYRFDSHIQILWNMRRSLWWWRDHLYFFKGLLWTFPVTKRLTSGAGTWGWGASLDGLLAQGRWNSQESRAS